jgi:hypothetical protein
MLILKPFTRGSWSVDAAGSLASITFISRVGFSTSTLAYLLDSLVRVSRRVGKNHFGKIAQSPSGSTPTSTGGLTAEAAQVSQACVDAEPHLASRRGNQLSLPHVSHAALFSAGTAQWLGKHLLSTPKNKFLPLPSQRFQVF